MGVNGHKKCVWRRKSRVSYTHHRGVLGLFMLGFLVWVKSLETVVSRFKGAFFDSSCAWFSYSTSLGFFKSSPSRCFADFRLSSDIFWGLVYSGLELLFSLNFHIPLQICLYNFCHKFESSIKFKILSPEKVVISKFI